uniref:Uncharacterized protein n=1 Tax=Setaria viridis TaxID=4556 RepID=A0A4U6WIE3_SETVI|nr:hypothetical protein SEVIR_1G072050v2 [Setaria viridis]
MLPCITKRFKSLLCRRFMFCLLHDFCVEELNRCNLLQFCIY